MPLGANTQTTEPLTCPAASQYYEWKGKPTSAQYYVNPKGVSTEVGCQWGDGSRPIGNWAPINLGVGQHNGKWLSIFQNSPTTNERLDFNIKIQGDNLSGSCRYENGKYYSLTGSNDSGCTVCLLLSRPVSWNFADWISNRSRSSLAMPTTSSTKPDTRANRVSAVARGRGV